MVPVQASSFAFTAVEGRRMRRPNCRCVTRARQACAMGHCQKGLLSHCWAWCCLQCAGSLPPGATLGRVSLAKKASPLSVRAVARPRPRLNTSCRVCVCVETAFCIAVAHSIDFGQLLRVLGDLVFCHWAQGPCQMERLRVTALPAARW